MTERSAADARLFAYEAVEELAAWSAWAAFAEVSAMAPQRPGVYQIRLPAGAVVYVGMAGERRGQGVRGRLSIYRRGRGAVSGFGEAALDRALADVDFVQAHLDAIRAGVPSRASAWARDAIASFSPEVRWATCDTKERALELEAACVELLRSHGIWNRAALKDAIRVDAATLPSNGLTVGLLTAELGLDDGGRAVRSALRRGFPEHERSSRWGVLSDEQVAYVLEEVRTAR